MNNRNQQTARATAPAEATAPTYLNVFTVEEYEANGKTQKKWTRIGAAWPHEDGEGFNVQIDVMPFDGKIVLRPSKADTKGPEVQGAQQVIRDENDRRKGARREK